MKSKKKSKSKPEYYINGTKAESPAEVINFAKSETRKRDGLKFEGKNISQAIDHLNKMGHYVFIKMIVLAVTVGVFLLLCTKCSGQTGTFNYRSGEEGKFTVVISGGQIFFTECLKNAKETTTWSEEITEQSKSIMGMEVYTRFGRYVLFFCPRKEKQELPDHEKVCEMYIYPVMGDVLHYFNKLN